MDFLSQKKTHTQWTNNVDGKRDNIKQTKTYFVFGTKKKKKKENINNNLKRVFIILKV